jgi:hypothetical protein
VTTTGGVHVNGKDGDLTPVRVSSVSIINHEFWVKTPDGVEHDVKLRGVDIPLRTGQEISLISAVKKYGSPLHTILLNHTASKRWILRDASVLNTELELTPFNWKTVLIVSGLCVAGIATAGLGLLAAGGYLCFALYQGSQRKKLLVSDLNAYLSKLDNLAASRTPTPSVVQVEEPAQAELSFQLESPAPAQTSVEPESPELNRDSVRRALSRNL